MTNGDEIRQMTNEELAELLLWNVCTVCDGRGFKKCGDDKHCKKHVVKWLKQEGEENILKQPVIEAELVRRGEWLPLKGWFNKSIVKCSVCGNTLDMDGVNAGRGDANFCPNCGTNMKGGTV